MSLKRNVVANYIGQGWKALMGLAFIPLYIKYLGVEAYGLIGIFAILQSWLVLMDMGMKPALGREMARFTAGAHDAQSIRDLLRSIEIVGVAIACAIIVGAWACAGWLATDWVKAQHLSVGTVTHAFAIMGIVAALRFVEDIYVSSLVGLQRQVLQNVVVTVIATLRGLGVVGVLAWVSPTISAFFIWQGAVSLLSVGLFVTVVYRTLPRAVRPARFSKQALVDIWRFAAGMMLITSLAMLLTQIDKILLSRQLSLTVFGYYALASVVANGLYVLTSPITTAFYPRFTELVARGDGPQLRKIYHQGAQLVTVLTGSAAVLLIVFGHPVVLLWTGDGALTQKVVPLLRVLVLGTFLNTLMWIPYQFQLANAWTGLTVKINAVAVAALVPAILWVVPRYGAIGAAWVWVVLNGGYLTFSIYFMHRRLLRAEKWCWYRQDVLIPILAAGAAAELCRWILPQSLGNWAAFGALLLSAACVFTFAIMAAPAVRRQVFRYLFGKARSASANAA